MKLLQELQFKSQKKFQPIAACMINNTILLFKNLDRLYFTAALKLHFKVIFGKNLLFNLYLKLYLCKF